MSYLQQINTIILECFDEESLSRAIRFGMDLELDRLTGKGDLTAKVFELTRHFEREGKLFELIEALKKENDNPALESIIFPKIRYAENVVVPMSEKEYAGLDQISLRLRLLQNQIGQLEKDFNRELGGLRQDVEKLSNIVVGENMDNGLVLAVRDLMQDTQKDSLTSNKTFLLYIRIIIFLGSILLLLELFGNRLPWIS